MVEKLRARGVSVRAGSTTILRDVNAEFYSGQLTAIIGPNGAGKSTFLDALAGSRKLASGVVDIDGQELSSFSAQELAAKRAVMLQDTRVAFSFTVRDVVAMGCHGEAGNNDRIDRALQRAGVTYLQSRDVTSLSGGERARVAFARTLAQDADIVMLDEPTAALDVAHQELLLQVCKEEARAGKLVVAVLHDLDLAFAHADRVVVLSEASIAAQGEVENIRDSSLLSSIYGWPIDVLEAPGGGYSVVVRR